MLAVCEGKQISNWHEVTTGEKEEMHDNLCYGP
jgi:uncharacterized cysteine cluster protein YcgN (CxxCxxCC family)